jgi:ParB family chromosome partitioning protein
MDFCEGAHNMTNASKEKPRHLGRGLQSLLGPITMSTPSQEIPIPIAEAGAKLPSYKDLRDSIRQLALASIQPNPYQPRTVWNEQELEELAESIRANGIIQPIIVRPAGDGFELIAGERRVRAAKIAGLDTVPAIVRHATDEELLELALVENIHRSDLNPMERAQAYQRYVTEFSLSQSEAAQRLGENRSVVANYLRLLDLPEDIKRMLIEEQLSMGHARAILSLPTDDLRRKLANRAMAGRLSVREVEKLVRRYLTGSVQPRPASGQKPSHIVDLENRLTGQLGTKVSIETRRNGQRGRIVVEFYSLDEFERIIDGLGLTCEETL